MPADQTCPDCDQPLDACAQMGRNYCRSHRVDWRARCLAAEAAMARTTVEPDMQDLHEAEAEVERLRSEKAALRSENEALRAALDRARYFAACAPTESLDDAIKDIKVGAADAVKSLNLEVTRLRDTDAACGEIHRLCADAGVPVGHVVDRVRALVEKVGTERQAAISIAATCLSAGLVPQGVEGTVEAVRVVCAEVVRLRARCAHAAHIMQDLALAPADDPDLC